MQLVQYEAACAAVAAARTIDEVKEITNRSEAMRAYAKQAKNRQMEIDAIEIRVRAERRLGEILLVLRHDGQIGQGRGGRPVRLKEIGVDTNTSASAQRLAKLDSERFEQEMGAWRKGVEVSSRLEMPLQRYRKPAAAADHEKAAHRFGRARINANDPLDAYRSMDGRRVSDWRSGELNRIEETARRVVRLAEGLRNGMPVANPDPLDTMEMIFGKTALIELLATLWSSLPAGDAGVRRHVPIVTCRHCGSEFRSNGQERRSGQPNAGQYCSRQCSFDARKAHQ